MESAPDFPVAPSPFRGRARSVDAGACFEWLRQGWAFFIADPGVWVAATVVVILVWLALSIVPVIGQLVANLLMPLFAAGLLECCRQQTEGRRIALGSLFAGFGKRAGGLVVVGILFALALFAVMFVVATVVGGSLAGGILMGNSPALMMLFGGALLGGLLGLVLMVPVLMAVAFAPALVFFHDMLPVDAMQASFRAAAVNWLPLGVHALFLFVLAFFAALPVGLGFFLLIPVASGATYAAYRDIFPAS